MAIANWTCVSWVAYTPGTIAVCYMDRKRIQCFSNASQHVPIYLQPFLRYSGRYIGGEWLVFNSTRERMSVFNHILLSLGGYVPGTIAVNVTWIEREFNACQTHRSMYTSIFNHFTSYSEILVGNRHFFLPPLHLTPPYGVGQSR